MPDHREASYTTLESAVLREMILIEVARAAHPSRGLALAYLESRFLFDRLARWRVALLPGFARTRTAIERAAQKSIVLHDIDRAAQKSITPDEHRSPCTAARMSRRAGCAARFCAMTAPDLDRRVRPRSPGPDLERRGLTSSAGS